jgi:hypothetical protein
MITCERCRARGEIFETPVNRVLYIVDVTDEGPDDELITAIPKDAFAAALCLTCASEVQQLIQRFIDEKETT